MTKNPALELRLQFCGPNQMRGRLHEDCTLVKVKPKILFGARHVHAAGMRLVFASSIHAERRRKARCLEQKPNGGLLLRYFFDHHQYGRLGAGCLGLGEKQQPQACARTDTYSAQEKRAGSLKYVFEALVVEFFQCGYDALDSFAAHRSSLRGYFRNCLQSNALLFPEFQPKLLPFSPPLSGV